MPNEFRLQYLFEAHLKDGTVIHQNDRDCSELDPTKSCFYDVTLRLEDVRVFGLYNNEHTYTVSLEDGHFEIDGVPFSAQPTTRPCINEGGKFTLVYFRDHQQDMHVAAVVGEDGQVTQSYRTGDHRHQYRMGWEYIDPNGVVYAQTIVII